ncbi:hypothetical protein [Chloroflexus sp.]|uniref:hypothetical protein n=1 Tax=Chloroflexus sp. TaxID=1904827 RepID=UPI002627C86E|nr:hypothetical protein [uncultured Chloroflexus sp.]
MATAQVDLAMLTTAVRRAGGEPSRIAHVLELFRERLIADSQPPPQTLYVYRTASVGTKVDAPVTTSATPPVRPRILLAFLSADTAVSFAQSAGLTRVPQLHTLSLARLLTVFLQQPALSALRIAYEDGHIVDGLPTGWHLSRPDVLSLFAIDAGVF